MRKLLIVAVLGMVLAIAACGPGAEPTPTPTSTPKVVATPTPTAKPLATPTATSTTGVVATPTPTAKPLATPTATPRPVVATPTPTAAPLATPTATPKRGGILRVRTQGVIPSFYALQTAAGSGKETVLPAYNGLLAQDPLDPTSDKIVPDLADRWEISSDGLTITLFLHQGVKWQDGVPFTAADVKYTLDLILKPPAGFVSARRSDFAAVASVEVPNNNTVVLKLSRISNTIISVLAGPYNVMMPKHLIEKDVINSMKAVMMGTGPYLFKKLTPEQILVHERNPSYWKPGLPYLDGIQFIPIADLSSYMAALYTGQIDTGSAAARTLGKIEMQRIQKERPELLRGTVPTLKMTYFGLNTKIPPLTDQRVREALQESIDREGMLSMSSSIGQVGGMAQPGSYWVLPAEELAKLPGFGPDISARRARARQLLKDAGIAAGTEITLSTKSTNALNVEIVELMQLQLGEALPSLKVKIRNYSSAEWDVAQTSFNLQADYEQMAPATSDPDNFGQFYTTGGSRNYTGISDPRIDELQLKQSSILDPAQRREIFWQVQKLVIQQAALVPMFFRQDVCPAWPYVKNQVCASSSDGISNRYEIVWLDK